MFAVLCLFMPLIYFLTLFSDKWIKGIDSSDVTSLDLTTLFFTVIAAFGGAISAAPIIKSIYGWVFPKVDVVIARSPFNADYGSLLQRVELLNKRSTDLYVTQLGLYRETDSGEKLFKKLPGDKLIVLKPKIPYTIEYDLGEVLLSGGIDGKKRNEQIKLCVYLCVSGIKKPVIARASKESKFDFSEYTEIGDSRALLSEYVYLDKYPKPPPRMPLNTDFLITLLDLSTNYVLYINFIGGYRAQELRELLYLPPISERIIRLEDAFRFLAGLNTFKMQTYLNGRMTKRYLLLDVFEKGIEIDEERRERLDVEFVRGSLNGTSHLLQNLQYGDLSQK